MNFDLKDQAEERTKGRGAGERASDGTIVSRQSVVSCSVSQSHFSFTLARRLTTTNRYHKVRPIPLPYLLATYYHGRHERSGEDYFRSTGTVAKTPRAENCVRDS